MRDDTRPDQPDHGYFGRHQQTILDLVRLCRPSHDRLVLPTVSTVFDTVRRANQRMAAVYDLDPIRSQAAFQSQMADVQAYLTRFLLGPPWEFVGDRLSLTGTRTDLVWRDPAGAVVVDLLFTGRARMLDATPNRAHVRSRLAAHPQVHGTDFLGARVLTMREWPRSHLATPSGRLIPLTTIPTLLAQPNPITTEHGEFHDEQAPVLPARTRRGGRPAPRHAPAGGFADQLALPLGR